MPVPSTTKPEPNGKLILSVDETLLPSLSTTEKCVVFVPKLSAVAMLPNSLLGVARSTLIVSANPSA